MNERENDERCRTELQVQLTVTTMDLERAIEDRSKLLAAVKQVYELSWRGMEQTMGRTGYALFSQMADLTAIVKTEVEGT